MVRVLGFLLYCWLSVTGDLFEVSFELDGVERGAPSGIALDTSDMPGGVDRQ